MRNNKVIQEGELAGKQPPVSSLVAKRIKIAISWSESETHIIDCRCVDIGDAVPPQKLCGQLFPAHPVSAWGQRSWLS